MNNVKIITSVCLGVLGAMLPQAKADVWNQKTIFTFNAPVEIPGGIVLSPGTYVFKLMDSQSDRNIVEVFNKDENHVYGTFLAISNYRLKPTGKSILSFEERAAGTEQTGTEERCGNLATLARRSMEGDADIHYGREYCSGPRLNCRSQLSRLRYRRAPRKISKT